MSLSNVKKAIDALAQAEDLLAKEKAKYDKNSKTGNLHPNTLSDDFYDYMDFGLAGYETIEARDVGKAQFQVNQWEERLSVRQATWLADLRARLSASVSCRRSFRQFALSWADQIPAAPAKQPSTDLSLVVILGLPGLGKSYLMKQIGTRLAHSGVQGVLIVHKDMLTARYQTANGGANPKMKHIRAMVADQIDSSQPRVLVFNMNMNPHWLRELIQLVPSCGYKLNKLVVLTPPLQLSFRALQAAAVVLAGQRSGDEPEDMRSTLSADKAWSVLTGDFFGDPKKATTFRKLLDTVNSSNENLVVEQVHYPVPCLGCGVSIPESMPNEQPVNWDIDNIAFPEATDFDQTFHNLLQSLQ